MELENVVAGLKKNFDRRRFLQSTAVAGLGVAATTLIGGSATALAAQSGLRTGLTTKTNATGVQDPVSKDTPAQIFTAALIAEDLATTFYYNGLVGAVLQDPNLAGPGGTVTHAPKGDQDNVNYIRAALFEESTHANLFRDLLGISGAANDPVQTFYFPAGTFDTLGPFIGTLEALENAFIGAYLAAIREFARMAAVAGTGSDFTSAELSYFAQVSAAIMGIECEHRVLGRDIESATPANNRNYEAVDGIRTVYNGSHSAVTALTPFLTASTGPAFDFADAVTNRSSVWMRVGGALPPE
jgi:Ferritin-like domain